MANGKGWSEHTVEVSGAKLHVRRSGSGSPILILHHDIGTLDKLAFYDELAASHDVVISDFPGWGRSPRLEWMRHPRDVAILLQGLKSELGLSSAALIGLGFGGWVAAEMAAMAPREVAKLVLVGAMGIKPTEGDILDQAIISYIDYPQAFFHERKSFEAHYGNVTTDQLEAWDIAREMSFRIAWKPYMYSQSLPHLLGAVKAPTLLVWGDDDKVVPVSAAHRFKTALPNARLEIVKGSGHAVEMEKASELLKLVSPFLAAE